MTSSTELDSRRADHLRSLEQEVGVLIRRVRRVIGERSRAVHPQLQPASYLMLGYLVTEGPMRSSAMAEAFDIDKGAISRQVGHLEELGLVERTPDPADGRASLVSASADAVRRLEDIAADRRRWISEQLGDWSEEQLELFTTELSRYNQALNA
jgi:DNA-binding MarR family transcriptional regulator